MRSVITFTLSVASLAFVAPAFAAGDAVATTQILQQRTADGRLLLTDRPVAGAKTERAWQIDAVDTSAARQRALDVKVEAQVVSERIQRRIEQQERLAAASAERDRLERLQYERQRAADLADDDAVTGLVYAPRAFRHRPHMRLVRFDSPRPQASGSHAARMAHFTGPAAL
ncbi:MAG: hypothetical protein ABJA61_03045 [Caldimonas sp.]